jgi:flagellar M-ring protein FliF
MADKAAGEQQATTKTTGAAPGTALERRFVAGTQALHERLSALPGTQRWIMLGSVCILLAIVGGMLYLAFRPDMRVLLSGMEAHDAQQVEQELTAASIQYDVTPDGATIRVPANSLNAARIAVASKGLPSSGRMGFEIFDKPNWVGSEFDERVNYQRALEGELEHTIESINAIQQAHVNVVMPHDSLFTDEQRDAKASVVLTLRHHLSDEEAASIRNLVAGAVDTLKPAQVVLVDANGHQQFGPKSALAEQSQYEQTLESKLIATLAPVAGVDNVRASVTADFDSGSEDDLDVQYDPNNVATLSMQSAQTTSAVAAPPGGVPGTATNAPNVKPPVYPQQAPQTENTKQENGTYAVTQHTRHHVQGPGRVRRVTAAILINDRRVVSPDGKHISWKARTPAELAELQQLAQAAVGFDTSRGDKVTVQNLSFADNSTAAGPGLASRLMSHAGDNSTLIRNVVLLLVFVMAILFIVRPVLAQMKSLASSVQTLPASAARASLPTAVAEYHALDQTGELSFERQQARAQYLYDRVAEYVRKEPVHSTRLLQSWVRTQQGS